MKHMPKMTPKRDKDFFCPESGALFRRIDAIARKELFEAKSLRCHARGSWFGLSSEYHLGSQVHRQWKAKLKDFNEAECA